MLTLTRPLFPGPGCPKSPPGPSYGGEGRLRGAVPMRGRRRRAWTASYLAKMLNYVVEGRADPVYGVVLVEAGAGRGAPRGRQSLP